MSSRAGLGLRVKTARAVAVVVTGSLQEPRVLFRRELSLWDPSVPESKQPFHAGLGLAHREANPIIERASDAVRLACQRALHTLIKELRGQDPELIGAGLVRSSDRDPATVKNPHMHAHAAEGQLFYEALADAAAGLGVRTSGFLEKRVVRDAAHHLRMRESSVARAIAKLGTGIGPPWRAEEKLACAAAWLMLSQAGGRKEQSPMQTPLLRNVDCFGVQVPNIDEALAFYGDKLGHRLLWRRETSAGLAFGDEAEMPELVLHTDVWPIATAIKVESVPDAIERFVASGGVVVESPSDIPIGRLAVVSDPWGNKLVLLDSSKGQLTASKGSTILTSP